MTLEDLVNEYYIKGNYNCAETLLHACNDYYVLCLNDQAIRMMGGFGGGMFSGLSCGALIGCNAALSRMLIENKAHEEMDVIRPATQKLVRNFRNETGGTSCVEIKPLHHSQENRCLKTCQMAARAMMKTTDELGIRHI